MGIIGESLGLIGKKAVSAVPSISLGAGAVAIGVSASKSVSGVPDKPAGGPLAALDPSKNPFNFDRLSYPLNNLGAGQKYPHFISFYLNVRNQSKYVQQNRINVNNRESVLQSNARQRAGYDNTELPIIGDTINFKRKTTRTTSSIHLYMPDSMHWTFRNDWRAVGLTDALPAIFTKAAELGADVVQSIKGGLSDGSHLSTIAKDILSRSRGLATESVGSALGIDRDLSLSTLGYAINPNIDVIYGAPELRSFVFDFVFAPRSSQEANQVLAIIRAFKFGASPESAPDSGAGRYWIPPTEFDIECSVSTLGKISTCVLESIDVDYAPNGWSAYAEEIPSQDMPTNIRMQLSFRELEFITKELVSEGY